MDIFVPTQFHSNVCLQAWQHLKPSVYSKDVIIKRLMLVLKVSNFYLFFFFFLMANSSHSTEIKTHSFISRFLFCFGGGCIPSRLQSFRCPKQCLVTRS